MPTDRHAESESAAGAPAADASTSDGRGVLVITNSRAGTSVVRPDPLPEIRRRLSEARIESLGESSMDDIVASAMSAADAPTVLAVLGGDGSVSRAAHLARRHDLTLLVLPGGTFNHFARAAGVDTVEAALDAYDAGSVRSVVVAEAVIDDGDPVTVLNAVSLGAYPEMLAEREKRTSLGKWWGGAIAAWREMHGAHRITIVRDGRRAVVWSVFAGIGRGDPRRIAMMRRASLDEPELDVRLHHARGTRLRAVTSLAFGRRTLAVMRALRLMPPASDLERAVVSEIELTVRPGEATPVLAHDGELAETPTGDYRLRLRAIPDGLRVYAR
ncbi:diacylglycerol kinase family protein [Microbacterium sp. NE2HP2]|uniref:diacylglycerol/lipid kinase family protein n=1 Tax=Microbacterium TaxID=33882 RepID=UPI0023672479|nr:MULTISPECIES: diacylglycerol kinase family protein [Microbacterium]MDD7945596.1 diacylglycerol kinase family protein [Microbacterium plantarum]WHE35863.1 diacylglycerol kinase family protein [Microbacterium sp. BDGP8]WRK17033.1 diacylglycerol kinase family protein [Microbacterium plantarum]